LYVHGLIHGFSDIPDVDPGIRDELNARLLTEGARTLYDELVLVDPEFASTLDPTKSQRIIRGLEVFQGTRKPLSSFHGAPPLPDESFRLVVLHHGDRKVLYDRIDNRVHEMVDAGMEAEVREALSFHADRTANAYRTIGVQEWFPFFDRDISREDAISLIQRNSRRYAKRQLTWYKRYASAEWIDSAIMETEAIVTSIAGINSA